MATQTQNQNHQNDAGSYGGSSFEPISNDVDTIEPDAYPGEYQAVVAAAKPKMSNSGKPMLIVEWKLLGTEDESEGCQKSIGSTVPDYIVYQAGRNGNTAKVKQRNLRDTLELDPDVIPGAITSLDDLKPLAQALRGQKMTVWIANKTDDDGNVRTNVHYTAPRSAGTMGAMGNGDEEAEEAQAPARGKAAASVKPKGKPARR
jgi:hypothetical protein